MTAGGGGLVNAEGDVETAEGDSINVDGKLAAEMTGSFVFGGGGISESSTLRFLPFGAGSSGGDRLYVTVLVTTDLTLTGLGQALLGGSKWRRVVLSTVQSAGENGEQSTALLIPLMAVRGEGPQAVGEKAGECGMRSRLNAVGVLRLYGVGGTELVGDL